MRNRPALRRAALSLALGTALALCSPSAVRAAEEAPGRSTAAAPGSVSMTLTRDRADWRLEAGYSLRWDFGDVLGVGPGLRRALLDPVSLLPTDGFDILENTRLRLYGMTVHPSRLLVQRIRRPEHPRASDDAGPSDGPAVGPAPREDLDRRWRLSLRPLVDDLRRNLRGDIQDALLKGSLDHMGPGTRSLGRREREALFEDVYKAGDSLGLPYLDLPKRGLDILIKEGLPR